MHCSKIYVIALFASATVLSLSALDPDIEDPYFDLILRHFTHTCDGKPITIQTLPLLNPTPPPSAKASVKTWLNNNDKLIENFTTFPSDDNIQKLGLQAFTDRKVERNKFLADYKEIPTGDMLTNKSSFNLVIPILKGEYILKISGIGNLLYNAIMEGAPGNEYPWPSGDDLNKPSYMEQLVPKLKKQFAQTGSALAYQHLLEKAIEKKNLDRIKIATSYAVRRPGKPKELYDSNYVLIQKTFDASKTVAKNLKDVDLELLKQLHIAMVMGVLWNGTHNFFLAQNPDTRDNEIIITDLEQPNNSKVRFFFYQTADGIDKLKKDIHGIDEFGELLKHHGSAEQQEVWEKLTNFYLEKEKALFKQ